jgi:hypothetical protein
VGAVVEAGVGAPEAPAGVEETESEEIVSINCGLGVDKGTYP